MLTLYTAVGILRFQDSIKEHKTPTVINNRQEYGLTEEEFFLWSSLAFQIRQIHELQSAFSERLKKHHRSENIPIEPYLNRLLLRGLVVKGDGLTGVDALYPYIALQDCLVVDMERIEDTPIIYNTITQKVYENGQWSKQDLDLHGKLLIYVKSSPPMPAATEQINNGF